MRKITLTIAALATMTIAAKAQMSVRFAPEVGLNFTNMNMEISDEKIDTKFKPGLKIGAVVDLGIAKKLSIQPGVFFTTKGTKVDDELGPLEVKYTRNTSNIEVPVNVVYHFGEGIGDGLFVQAGPYVGYAIGGKDKSDIDGVDDVDLEIGSDEVEDDLKPLDFGFNVGVGYQIPMGLFARVQYGMGLANLSPQDNTSQKNWGFGLSVGYFFGGK